MSERLETTDADDSSETSAGANWATGDYYSRMNIEAGSMGEAFYLSIPVFTILTKTREEVETVNDEFSALLSKYTDQIIVGGPHEASLILSINQAAAEWETQNGVIEFLRERIREITGSDDAAGNWEDKG